MLKTYALNRKASHDYELLEKFEAGIKLKGYEVKSIKNNRANLRGAFVIIRGGDAYLVGASIPAYQEKNTPSFHEEDRTIKLLLNQKELDYLYGISQQKGLTLVPIKLYNKKGLIKLEFAVARGKKKYDKRESIKKRDAERDAGRRFKG